MKGLTDYADFQLAFASFLAFFLFAALLFLFAQLAAVPEGLGAKRSGAR
jgi:hypothetical protein